MAWSRSRGQGKNVQHERGLPKAHKYIPSSHKLHHQNCPGEYYNPKCFHLPPGIWVTISAPTWGGRLQRQVWMKEQLGIWALFLPTQLLSANEAVSPMYSRMYSFRSWEHRFKPTHSTCSRLPWQQVFIPAAAPHSQLGFPLSGFCLSICEHIRTDMPWGHLEAQVTLILNCDPTQRDQLKNHNQGTQYGGQALLGLKLLICKMSISSKLFFRVCMWVGKGISRLTAGWEVNTFIERRDAASTAGWLPDDQGEPNLSMWSWLFL